MRQQFCSLATSPIFDSESFRREWEYVCGGAGRGGQEGHGGEERSKEEKIEKRKGEREGGK